MSRTSGARPMLRRRVPAALLPPALAIGLAACGGAGKGPAPAPAATVPAGVPGVAEGTHATAAAAGPRIAMPSGAVYRLELANTPEEQAQGLMFRESLPEKTGMLFRFSDGGVHKFWMKNTMIPLDMIWLDRDGKVLFVSADTPPCKADPCGNYGPDTPAMSVLEIAGGLAAKEQIKPGVVLKILDVK